VAFVVFPTQIIPDDGKIPQVVGLLYDEAVNRLEAAGFKAKTGEERFVELAPKSTVLAQSPPPGATEPRGTEVLLDVSAGQRQLQVPPVVGLTQALAQDAIEKAGLEVGEAREQESQAARGSVLSTSPTVGTTVSPSTRVDLVVSSGPPAVNTPDVVGQSYSTARAMLEQVGLRLGDVVTDSLATGIPQTVISQTPAAGSRLAAGSRVSLSIAP
jgi:serine/threonine-protein kinase